MSVWAVAPLSADSWAPARHFPAPIPKVAPARYTGPLLRLGELVEFLSARSRPHADEAIVTPGGVSPLSGTVQPRERVPAGTVFRLGQDLQPGDVLVPLTGKGPCVYVVPQHAGLAFSRGFAALRTHRAEHSQILWALLSSRSGLDARHAIDPGAVVPRISTAALAEVLVPELTSFGASVHQLLPDPAVDEIATNAVVSYWRTVSLQSVSNWEPARLLDPLAAPAGVPITDLGRVWAGGLDAREYKDSPFPGGTPALRPSDVGRISTPRWWVAAAGERDIAKPDSIMVGALSLRVASAAHPVAVARDILVLDVQPRPGLTVAETRDRLVAYLGSAAGQRRLANLKTGSTIPRVSKRSFLTLRVPAPESLPSPKPSTAELLETRLEKALWS